MFGLFKSKSPKEKLVEKRNKLLKQAFMLGKSDRSGSDRKMAEAEALLKEIAAAN